MTVFVPTNDCARVAVEGVWNGQQVAQTFWFTSATSPITQAMLIALATHVCNNWNASMLTAQSTGYALQRVTATRQNSSNDIQGVFTPSSPIPGTGGSPSVPLNCCWVFTYRTALRGRNYRGRGYQPGLINSILTNPGEGNLATLVGLAGNYVNWFITSGLAGWTWQVVSHWLNKSPRALGVYTPVTSVGVNAQLDSQRRRLIGRGS